jgi:hypothetical protein
VVARRCCCGLRAESHGRAPAANPELHLLLRASGLAAGSGLLAGPLAPGPVRSHHPLDLLVQPQLIAQEAFLAPDRVRDRGRLAPILGGEDVRRVAILRRQRFGLTEDQTANTPPLPDDRYYFWPSIGALASAQSD